MTDKPHPRPYLELASDERRSMMEYLGVTEEELAELFGEEQPPTRGDEFIKRESDGEEAEETR